MRRTIAFLVLGVFVTGVSLFGLAWMTTLKERGWSSDHTAFQRQAIFLLAVVSIVIVASALNRALNRPRSPRRVATDDRHNPALANRPDHPLRDRLLDG
jgi:hypothetical protein